MVQEKAGKGKTEEHPPAVHMEILPDMPDGEMV